jgi:hypothetical protein
MFLGPFRNFSRCQKHAIEEIAPVLKMEALFPAARWVRHETDGQNEIDNIHTGTSNPLPQCLLPEQDQRRSWDFSRCPMRNIRYKLRFRFPGVNHSIPENIIHFFATQFLCPTD